MTTNLTNAEYFRLHGALSTERIEALLDLEASVGNIETVRILIQEAKCGQVTEDAFSLHLRDLWKVCASLRGVKKENLENAIENLADKITDVSNSSDYAIENLNSALDELRGL